MIITTGRVHDGKIEVDPESFPEGVNVIILASKEGEIFELNAEDKTNLSSALARIGRGNA